MAPQPCPTPGRRWQEREPLLQTLAAWLEADRSAGLAAERLYCHRNTVLNRLQRISALAGHDLTGRQAFVELSLTLSVLELPARASSAARWIGIRRRFVYVVYPLEYTT